MKFVTNIIYGLLLALTASCVNDIESLPTSFTDKQQPAQVGINKRTYEEALEIARNSISILEKGNGVTRSSGYGRIVDENAVVISSQHNITRSTNCQCDTLLYVFNFNNEDGFAIISASSNTEGLIAITEKGHYDANKQSEIAGFEMFMDMAKNYVEKSKSRIIPPFSNLLELKDSMSVHESYFGPYVSVKWGSTGPLGTLYPDYSTGCAIVAMAQAMTYYEFPLSIMLTYDGAEDITQYLHWSEIKKHISGYDCNDSPSTHTEIARLGRQLGEIAGTNLESGTTNQENIKTAMQILGYQTGSWNTYNSTSLGNCIQQQKIAFMAGFRDNGDSAPLGHCWLLDGMYTRMTEYFTFIRAQNELFWNLLDYTTSVLNYYHFNWGAHGSNNGYFFKDVFDMSQVIIPDTNSNSHDQNYNINVSYLPIYHN